MNTKISNIKNLEIVTISSFDQIDKIRNEWDDLLKRINNDNIYVDPEFYVRMFDSRAPDGLPYLVLFMIDSVLIGLILGWTSNTKVPCWFGYKKFHTPSLKTLNIEIDGLITDGQPETVNELAKYLSSVVKNKEIELLSVNHLSEKNPLYDKIKSGIGFSKKAVYKQGIAWISTIRDFKTGKPFEINSPKTKANFRRKARRLLEHFNNELEIIEISSDEDLEYFIRNADIIGQKSYQYSIDVGVKNNDVWRKMLTSLVNGGYFRGYILMNNDKPIAYNQGAIYKNYYHLFATAYDPQYHKYSPGTYLLLQITDKLIKEEINYINYGFGDADYKKIFGTDSYSEATFRIYGLGSTVKIAYFLDKLSITFSESIKGILEKAGLFNKIKKFWRGTISKK
jgi:Acetyltransferase (GNAT) domain